MKAGAVVLGRRRRVRLCLRRFRKANTPLASPAEPEMDGHDAPGWKRRRRRGRTRSDDGGMMLMSRDMSETVRDSYQAAILTGASSVTFHRAQTNSNAIRRAQCASFPA
jgi:hypothetical protein